MPRPTTAVPVQMAPTMPTVNASGEPESCANALVDHRADLRADHWELLEDRIDQALLEIGVALQNEGATTVAKTSSRGNSEKNP